jgi:hypothetical protein
MGLFDANQSFAPTTCLQFNLKTALNSSCVCMFVIHLITKFCLIPSGFDLLIGCRYQSENKQKKIITDDILLFFIL